MNRLVVITLAFVVGIAFISLDAGITRGVDRHLGVNREITQRIRAEDTDFFRQFDVYRAGNKVWPHALLFDAKDDDYLLPDRFWGEPLSEKEIVDSIFWLDQQYHDHSWNFRFAPRALNIVNRRGQLVGYVYTSLRHIFVKRNRDGQTVVYLPTPTPVDAGNGDDELREGGTP
jgi:hypothetical protein